MPTNSADPAGQFFEAVRELGRSDLTREERTSLIVVAIARIGVQNHDFPDEAELLAAMRMSEATGIRRRALEFLAEECPCVGCKRRRAEMAAEVGHAS